MGYRKDWLWKKKKHSEKVTATHPELISSPHSARLYYEHELYLRRYSADHSRTFLDAMTPWKKQTDDERVRFLSEKLSAALSDIAAKATLVEQHAKVAEEAIAGWEKVETEAASLRKQLKECFQQKDEVDGLLRQCMRELRHCSEEQEERAQEEMLKNVRHWDSVRLELEGKVVEATNRLLEMQAENTALSNSLQDTRRDLSHQESATTAAETQVRQLKGRIQVLETKNSRMVLDLHVLNKELEIKKCEKDYAREATDFANKKQLEAARKVAKLEGECSRQRLLLRKKKPSAAALVQMKLQADASEGEFGGDSQKARPSLAQKNSSMKHLTLDSSENSNKSPNGSRDSEIFIEKLCVDEKDKKMLREYLAKRDEEFQEMLAKIAYPDKDRSEAKKGLGKAPYPHAQISRSSIFVDRVISSGAISTYQEDSCGGCQAVASTNSLVPSTPKTLLKLDFMGDFAEMERLASAMSPLHNPQIGKQDIQVCDSYLRCLQADSNSSKEYLSQCLIEMQESKQRSAKFGELQPAGQSHGCEFRRNSGFADEGQQRTIDVA